jgi:hypothetical protein
MKIKFETQVIHGIKTSVTLCNQSYKQGTFSGFVGAAAFP